MITITVNVKADALAGAVARLGNLAPAMATVGEILRGETLRNFREGGLFPAKWQKARRGGQTLVDKGTLRSSIVATSDATSAQVGTSLKYAAIHQYGGVIKAKNKPLLRFKVGTMWVSKKQVTLPARPFLPVDSSGQLSPDATRRIGNAIRQFIIQPDANPGAVA